MFGAFLNQSLWLDEAISYFAVKNFSFWEIITKFSPGDVHPPLYYLILKLWTDIFGYTELALRAPSFIATMIAVYVLSKMNKLAALFLALNPLVIYYAMEARMYAMTMLAVTAAFYFWTKKNKFWSLICFVAAIYLDYFPILLVPPLGIFLLPFLPIFWQQLSTSATLAQTVPAWGQVVGGLNLKAILLVPIKFIFGRIPSSMLMIPIITAYVWIMSKAKNKTYWLWLITPLMFGFLVSLKIPIFSYHRFLFIIPALCLLLAEGVKKSKVFIGLICATSIFSTVYYIINPSLYREDWRGAAAYINSDPGKVVMPSMAQSAPLVYYGAKLDANNNPVYLVRYVQEIFDPSDSQRIVLENSGYKNIQQRSFNGVIIWKYVF